MTDPQQLFIKPFPLNNPPILKKRIEKKGIERKGIEEVTRKGYKNL